MDAETAELDDAPTPYIDSPRHYGFHATLKAPMRMQGKYSYADLQMAVNNIASQLKPVALGQLRLNRVGSFLALVTSKELHPAVSSLAWTCVTELDHFRSELNDAERNKRSNLSSEEKENLEKWGYPYVGDRFRFHMTLTSSLNEEALKEAWGALEPQIPTAQITIDSISIFGDPGDAKPFEFVERFELSV